MDDCYRKLLVPAAFTLASLLVTIMFWYTPPLDYVPLFLFIVFLIATVAVLVKCLVDSGSEDTSI
ncbi:MAG: hypothetical protein JRN10_08410 [Nitrososphaerota archaeon]|jgi:hypothetical protein|nr:hypothetical protein [Nitrososphaerota archaeon]MDG6931240.1 hypothetical protein [Nitrososphaerota archaeon]